MKKTIKIILALAAVIIAAIFFKNAAFASLLSGGLSKAAHAPVSIGSTDVRFFSSAITLKDIRVNNTRYYKERTMFDAPLVSIHFDPSALFKGILHFQEVRLNLKEIPVIKNKNGELNVSALKPAGKDNSKPDAKAKKNTKLQIDVLYLTIGRVVYKDYTMGSNSMVQTFNIGIQDRVYKNITDPAALISTIMFESLTRTTLSQLANLDIGDFKNSASGILSEGLSILGSGGGNLKSKTKDLLNLLK